MKKSAKDRIYTDKSVFFSEFHMANDFDMDDYNCVRFSYGQSFLEFVEIRMETKKTKDSSIVYSQTKLIDIDDIETLLEFLKMAMEYCKE